MTSRSVARVIGALLGLMPVGAFAQRSIAISSGVSVSFIQVVNNITAFLAVSIVSICTVIFLLGATFLVGSRGAQDMVDRGKKMMKESLIGMAIVLGSYTILRTLVWLLYA